ncbi:hypothetical protein B0T14DRAFT_570855 [Immersiella caudata]|uniref:Uncharacterized protein n=1 Tax=Immersiella caudata TaxID=314043 RepID=A0AA39TKS4_9PEZI|nr:hypothetical protein B0T14DRAFT_570855 [Immersiella caudata]
MGDGIAAVWYRTTPNLFHCGDGGAAWGQDRAQSAKDGLEDSINVVVITGRKKAVLIVTVGGKKKEFFVAKRKRELLKVMLSEFKGVGQVKIELNGREEGPAITEAFPETGALSFNVVALDAVSLWTEGVNEEEGSGKDGEESGVVGGNQDGGNRGESMGEDEWWLGGRKPVLGYCPVGGGDYNFDDETFVMAGEPVCTTAITPKQ